MDYMKEYKTQLNKIRELKQSRNTDLFAKEIQRMSKQINQRFYRLEKAGVKPDTAYRYAQRETGKEKPRYSVSINKIKKMSLQEMYETAIEINMKLISPTTTFRGLKELEKKRTSKGLEVLINEMGGDVNEEDFKKFLNNGGGELLNRKWLDSYQVYDDWQSAIKQGLTTKEFIRSYKAEERKQIKDVESEFDYGQARRRIKGIAERKAERRKNRRKRK